MRKIKISIASECMSVCRGMKQILSSEQDFKILDEETILSDQLSLSAYKDIDIMMICNKELHFIGIEKLKHIQAKNPQIKIIIFNIGYSDKSIISFITYGVRGFVYINDPTHVIIQAIKKVFSGELWIKREHLSQLIESYYSSDIDFVRDNKLTKREDEILFLISSGHNNKDIAKNLGISLSTVKTHVYRLYRKTKIKNRAEAVRYYKGIE